MTGTAAYGGNHWEKRKADYQKGVRADEVEFRALKEGSSAMDESFKDETVDGSKADQLLAPVDERWIRNSASNDNIVGNVSMELLRRENLLGSAWPFLLDGQVLRLKKRRGFQTVVYEFCLALSRAPSVSRGEYKCLPIIFENLSLILTKHWLGGHADGVRTGWPREKGLPLRMKDLFTYICKRVGGHEWYWNPDRDKHDDPDPQHLKDSKLDLLTWLKMPDGAGHLYFMGQCSCGDSDIESKAGELRLSTLAPWVKPPSWVSPVNCFYIPLFLNPAKIAELSRIGGAVFDRSRLSLISQTCEKQTAEKIKKLLQLPTTMVISG